MKQLAAKLLLFLPILCLVAAVNYIADPSQLFGNGRIEREMAAIMLNGQNVSKIHNYDHRVLQREYFAHVTGSPNIVVLGSSRSMMLNASMFPQQSFYNASVAGASLEDYLAIHQLMLEQGIQPDTLILEISPWVFNRNNGQTRWKSLGSEYLSALNRLGETPSLLSQLGAVDYQKYAALFSLPYLQESLRWVSSEPVFYATTETETGEPMKLSDGSRVYSAEEVHAATDLAQLVEQSLKQPYSLQSFEQLDPHHQTLLEIFINSLVAQDIEVIILLAPYQPAFYEGLLRENRYQIVEVAEQHLRELAAQHGLHIIGSYDPTRTTCLSDEFYDGMHPKLECIERLLP